MDHTQQIMNTQQDSKAQARKAVILAFDYGDELQLSHDMQFLRLKNIAILADSGESSIRRWVANGEFPKPEKIGAQAVGWRRSEYEFWAVDPYSWKLRYQIRLVRNELKTEGQDTLLANQAHNSPNPHNIKVLIKHLNESSHTDWADKLTQLLKRYE